MSDHAGVYVAGGVGYFDPPTVTAQQKLVNFRTRRFYPNPRVVLARRILRDGILRQVRSQFVAPIPGPVWLDVCLAFPFPRSTPKKVVALGEIPKPSRPDVDNLVKSLLDEMTALSFWGDDAQVCELHVSKRMSSSPCVAIALYRL